MQTTLHLPRVEDLGVQREILYVAGDYGEAVTLGGGHNEAVHHWQGWLDLVHRVSRMDVSLAG